MEMLAREKHSSFLHYFLCHFFWCTEDKRKVLAIRKHPVRNNPERNNPTCNNPELM
jgi:hypothetical protein